MASMHGLHQVAGAWSPSRGTPGPRDTLILVMGRPKRFVPGRATSWFRYGPSPRRTPAAPSAWGRRGSRRSRSRDLPCDHQPGDVDVGQDAVLEQEDLAVRLVLLGVVGPRHQRREVVGLHPGLGLVAVLPCTRRNEWETTNRPTRSWSLPMPVLPVRCSPSAAAAWRSRRCPSTR